MKTIKILLSVLIALAVLILVGIGYVWSRLAFTEDAIIVPAPSELIEQVIPSDSSEDSAPVSENTTDAPSTLIPNEAFTVRLDSLPESQRSVLEALGMNDASFEVTPGMVECAVEALGTSRVNAIRNGDAPSLAEGLSLLSCSAR